MPMKKEGKKRSKSSESTKKKCSGSEENEYCLQVLDLKATCQDWGNLFSRSIEESRRILQWVHTSEVGEPLQQKYAWAVPSNAAIKVLSKFSPVVEMGAGKGYWAHLVQKEGGYIMPFDIEVPKKKEAWTKVSEGTPKSILSLAVADNKRAPLQDLNLFLCYPDQGSEVGLPSLEAFQSLTDEHNNQGQGPVQESKKIIGGGYIVHVGELLTTGCSSGAPQAPWGRTSSPDFQERLYRDYHCVLTMPLESFPFSRDFLTVWKRTVMYDAKDMEFEEEGIEEESGSESERDDQQRKKQKVEHEESGEEEELEENDDEWADIPTEERLPHTITTSAAPCMQLLLDSLQST